jgi:hypothetical protein
MSNRKQEKRELKEQIVDSLSELEVPVLTEHDWVSLLKVPVREKDKSRKEKDDKQQS